MCLLFIVSYSDPYSLWNSPNESSQHILKQGDALCKECFFLCFETEIHETIVRGGLFSPGMKVAIGASGGKGEIYKSLSSYSRKIITHTLFIETWDKRYGDEYFERTNVLEARKHFLKTLLTHCSLFLLFLEIILYFRQTRLFWRTQWNCWMKGTTTDWISTSSQSMKESQGIVMIPLTLSNRIKLSMHYHWLFCLIMISLVGPWIRL